MKLSELFYSLQGEGVHTGVPSYFIRLFSCSLQCQGFGQPDPADPSTWKQPWKTIPIETAESIEDLPQDVYEYGCDSVYSWSAKYKHLQKEMSAFEVVEKMKADMGLDNFVNLLHGKIHIIFTGGEPLMKANQAYIIDILKELQVYYLKYAGIPHNGWVDVRPPLNITFETNGTQPLTSDLLDFLKSSRYNVLFSVSPKLLHTSGEEPSKAIKPAVIASYNTVSHNTQVVGKFVVANTTKAKTEFLLVADLLKHTFSKIYIMPEGPNKSRIEDSSTDLAEFALEHGYCFSDRLHARLWDNKIGV